MDCNDSFCKKTYLATLPPYFKLQRPNMPISFGCNHGKLFVLIYKDKLRVIISTANLLKCDYDRKSQVCNFYFYLAFYFF